MPNDEIVVRVPGYAQAQIERGDPLHVVQGHHRLVDTRIMQVLYHDGEYLHVLDEDREIRLTEGFYAAFARALPPAEDDPEDDPEDIDESENPSAPPKPAEPENPSAPPKPPVEPTELSIRAGNISGLAAELEALPVVEPAGFDPDPEPTDEDE